MPIVLDGTTGITNPAGSASVPSLTTAGDTNTGMFFPAADTIAFTEGGTEVMRINSSGNVGIGTGVGLTSPTSILNVDGNNASVLEVAAFTNTSSANNTGSAIRLGHNTAGYGARVAATGSAGLAYGADLVFQAGNGGGYSETGRISASGNLQFNSGYGSVATAYGCRAWVNFNGTGTVAIRSSGNVSSITDNGVGLYTVNFTNAMPDTNYSYAVDGTLFVGGVGNLNYGAVVQSALVTTNFPIRAGVRSNNTPSDLDLITCEIFR